MKRRLILFLLLLFGGAIVNVAVAWGFAVWQTVPMYPRTGQSAFVLQNRPWQVADASVAGVSDQWWLDLQADYPGQAAEQTVAQMIAEYEMRTPGPQRTQWTVDAPAWGTLAAKTLPPPEFVIGSDTAFGWPLLCMWYQVRGKLVGNSTAAEELHGGRFLRGKLDARGRDFRALPLWPIWPGFAINTLFYAVILWLLFAAPLALRRRRRIKRGLCPKCGYPIGTSEKCTECGAAVRQTVAA